MKSKRRTVWRKCVQRALSITEQETATVRQKMRSKCVPSDRNPAHDEHRKHKVRTVHQKCDRKCRPSSRKGPRGPIGNHPEPYLFPASLRAFGFILSQASRRPHINRAYLRPCLTFSLHLPGALLFARLSAHCAYRRA